MAGGGGISRGHPLVALLAVLGGWVGGRAATWDAESLGALKVSASGRASTPPAMYAGPVSLPDAYRPPFDVQTLAAPPSAPMVAGGPAASLMPWMQALSAQYRTGNGWHRPTAQSVPHLADDFAQIAQAPRFYAPEPLPGSALPAVPAMTVSAGPFAASPARQRRWSVDAWALLRRDDVGALASPGAMPATYGASQAGAVLRYRLALASRYRPSVYLRTTSTTGLVRETSAALGLSARPLPSVPVVAAVEARLVDQGGIRRVQPVAMAVTEIPPLRMPAGFRAEAYAQAGYVAGRFATPFADGQVRADRPLVTLGKVDARIGAGVWGGVQKGAARLDAGPSASVTMPLGRGTTGRVSVDWRFRLAGDAVPGSGPAMTLSAGF